MNRIVAFGDVHMAGSAVSRLPDLETADLILVNGDLTNFGHRQDAEPLIDLLLSRNARVLALHGNLDHPDVEQLLIEKGVSLHSKGRRYGPIGVFGVGGSNITPFKTPTEYTEKEIGLFLSMAYESVSDCPHHILVSHPPPLNSKVDRIRSGLHVGSQEVRRFIEKLQPDLCITGHIHEARGVDRIGRTVVLNPGMLHDGGWIEVNVTGTGLDARLQAWP